MFKSQVPYSPYLYLQVKASLCHLLPLFPIMRGSFGWDKIPQGSVLDCFAELERCCMMCSRT